MKRLLAAVWVCIAAPAFAQTAVNVFPAPTGLKHRDSAAGSGMPAVVSRTSPGANWSIAFPSIPERTGPIVGNATSNQWASASYRADGALVLEQHGAGLTCAKVYGSGAKLVTEFDGMLTPPRIDSNTATPLSGLKSAVLNGTVTAFYSGPSDLTCKMNVTTPADSLTLWNNKTKSVFFYQLKLGAFAANHTMHLTSKTPSKGWVSIGRNQQTGDSHVWGVDDSAPITYQTPLMQYGVPLTYAVDVLPRLEEVIANGGKFGIDTDLDDWAITGEYLGSSVFGHVDIKTVWTGLSLMETPK